MRLGWGTDARASHSPIPTNAVLPTDMGVRTPGPLGEQSKAGGEHRQGRNPVAAPPWLALYRPVHSLRDSHTASHLATPPTSEETMSLHSHCTEETEAQRGYSCD